MCHGGESSHQIRQRFDPVTRRLFQHGVDVFPRGATRCLALSFNNEPTISPTKRVRASPHLATRLHVDVADELNICSRDLPLAKVCSPSSTTSASGSPRAAVSRSLDNDPATTSSVCGVRRRRPMGLHQNESCSLEPHDVEQARPFLPSCNNNSNSGAYMTAEDSAALRKTRALSASALEIEEADELMQKRENEDDEDEDKAEPLVLDKSSKRYGYAIAMAMLMITIYSYRCRMHGKSTAYVWWCGWLTAVATGVGALPFVWIRDVNKFWLGICNGLAAGMMLAATGCLFYEAWFIPQRHDYGVAIGYRLFVGILLGVLFIKFTKLYLEDYEDVKVCGLKGIDARKALLIMAVMTLHSVSEGIGVGVSFGGEGGVRRGHIVTMTMAIHNIPEGVAISLALVPRGLSVFFAVIWCILSSIPQPIFAVPSFMFVEQFLPILPAGLGFAGGAMAFVAVQELLPESLEDTKSLPATISATAMAFMVFLTVQVVLSGSF